MMSLVEETQVVKLREFPAHSDTVNCVALGPRSGNVAITGGQDKKVNLWCANRPNCLGSLQGHTSPVTSVLFSPNEVQACAGSEAGVLKVWDTNSSKLLRTLTGHRGKIKCIDFDHDGDSIVSGSGDSVIKLWDTRKKGCILSYQGWPSTSVTAVKFSPCSQFIASGATDSRIKLWDLRTGKLLHDMKGHSGHVNHLTFGRSSGHVMYSASMDRTVKSYNWKQGTLLSSTQREMYLTRRLFCHPSQKCILSAGENFVCAFFSEKLDSQRVMATPWGKVHDLVIPADCASSAFAVTSKWSSIAFFKVNMTCVTSPEEPRIPSKSFSPVEISGEPATHVKAIGDVLNVDSGVAITAEIPYETIFTPHQDLLRTPSKDHEGGQILSAKATLLENREAIISDSQDSPISDTLLLESQESSSMIKIFEDKVTTTANITSEFVSANSSLSSSSFESPVSNTSDKGKMITLPPEPKFAQVQILANLDQTDCVSPRASVVSESGEFSSDKKYVKSEKTFVVESSSVDRISNLLSESKSVCSQLHLRLLHLQELYRMWTTKEKQLPTYGAVSSPDVNVFVHYLDIIKCRPSYWNLDICLIIVPSLHRLLRSSCEDHILTGCSVIKLILSKFSPLITSSLATPPSLVGVDICQEERREKCATCCNELNAIRKYFESTTGDPQLYRGKAKQAVKDLLPLFDCLPQL